MVVLRCADVERSRKFYEALGLPMTPERHDSGPSHFSCTIGELVLELYPKQQHETAGLRLGFHVTNPDGHILELRTTIDDTSV